MKKVLIIMAVLGVLAQPAVAAGPSFGVGVAAGLDYPVAQDDQAQGTVFGFKGRLKLLPVVTLEPNIYFTKFGDPEYDEFTSDLEGSKVTSYGVDATFGSPFGAGGFNLYGVFGAGFYNVKRDQTDQDDTDLGWSGGLGFELGLSPTIAIDVRGKLNVVPSEGGGSKKSASVTGGLNLYLGK